MCSKGLRSSCRDTTWGGEALMAFNWVSHMLQKLCQFGRDDLNCQKVHLRSYCSK